MAGPMHRGSGADGDGVSWLVALAGCAVAAALVWERVAPGAHAAALAVASAHLQPFAWAARAFPAIESLPVIGQGLFARAASAMAAIEQAGGRAAAPGLVREALEAAGRCAATLYVPVLLWLGSFGRNRRVDIAHRRSHTLESMIQLQSQIWPTSRIARHANPLHEPEISAVGIARACLAAERALPGGPGFGALAAPVAAPIRAAGWHRALRPEEWLLASGLCRDRARLEEAERAGWKCAPESLEARERWRTVEIESICEMLAQQLRAPWEGYAALPPCHRALAAVMALFHAHEIDAGNALLGDLGLLCDATRACPGAMVGAIARSARLSAFIARTLSGAPGAGLLGVAESHGWVESAFPAMLEAARTDRGVLPAAAFLWLKLEDRAMWYILDGVGSDAVAIEAAGAMAHLRAERRAGLPLRAPVVSEAARALKWEYLDPAGGRSPARARMQERPSGPEHVWAILKGQAPDPAAAAGSPR